MSVITGFPQGEIFLLFFWLLVINTLLFELNQAGYYVQAIADDLYTIILGKAYADSC